MSNLKESKRLIEVCDSCGRASCYHGEFMCDDSATSETTLKTVAILDKIGVENKEHYSKERLFIIYGVAAPHGYKKDKQHE